MCVHIVESGEFSHSFEHVKMIIDKMQMITRIFATFLINANMKLYSREMMNSVNIP